MTDLTNAITSWKSEDEINELINKYPELVSTKEGEWYPRDWAERANNLSAYLILRKLEAPGVYPEQQFEGLLKSYVEKICNDYFSSHTMYGITESIWNQLYLDQEIFFVGQDPEYGLSEHDKDNFLYLIKMCEINSYEAWEKLINS